MTEKKGLIIREAICRRCAAQLALI